MGKRLSAARALPVRQPERQHEINEKRGGENKPVDDPDEPQLQNGGKKTEANDAPKPSVKGPGISVSGFHRGYLSPGGGFCNRPSLIDRPFLGCSDR